jgi:hypothetical protein
VINKVANLCASGELMRCSKCGSDSPAGKKFCADCGAPLTSRCTKCGSENLPSKRICGDCGTALAASDATRPAANIRVGHGGIAISAEATDSAVAEGERKTVTAVFADIKGSIYSWFTEGFELTDRKRPKRC